MQDFGKEPYIPTKSQMVCFYLSSSTLSQGNGFSIQYGQSPQPNSVKQIITCQFVVDEAVEKELRQKIETANERLLESVKLMFGWDWLCFEIVIQQHTSIKKSKTLRTAICQAPNQLHDCKRTTDLPYQVIQGHF